MKWLTQSAEQNHPGALLFLAYAYNDGDGVTQDSKKYLSYLFKAAELGESDAQLEVGYLNLIGEGMPKNLPEAYKWIKKSADQEMLRRTITLDSCTGMVMALRKTSTKPNFILQRR